MAETSKFRIDRIGQDKAGAVGGLFGFEIKSGKVATENLTDFSKQVSQAVDYSQCLIESDIVGRMHWFGHRLRYVFAFPCLYSICEPDNRARGVKIATRDLWAQGALKIAGKFGVGAMSYIPRKNDWVLLLGGHPAYWLKTGPTELALRHAQGEKKGSAK